VRSGKEGYSLLFARQFGHNIPMTIAQLFSALFNLGATTNFWNSNTAARDFWLVFLAAVVAGIAYVSLRALRHRREHTHPFGHSLHN